MDGDQTTGRATGMDATDMTADGDVARDGGAGPTALLRPGDTVWTLEHAGRATVLVDAAAYFAAVRRAMAEAEHAVTIIGWDVDSRTRLVGPDGRTGDDLPETLGEFLAEVVRRRPRISVRILLWDYSLLFALEREFVHAIGLQWATVPEIDVCLDDVLPVGSAQHQKVVVVDDAVAFAGGLDLTIRRWDEPGHRPSNPMRRDPAGAGYRPFHDVQMVIDGDAARALGDLARARWAAAALEDIPPAPPVGGDRWPEGLAPDFRDVRIGIARTVPGGSGSAMVNEVERLFEAMIDAAERCIYVENQFLTAASLADRLIERMRARPELEVLLVCPRTHHTWFEHRTMLAGRIRFMAMIRAAGLDDRVWLAHPFVGSGPERTEVMVHAKVMIVDDRILRVGSANLCNRSLGADSECDLAVEATTTEERRAIAAVRDRFLAEHCGADPADIAAALRRTGSILEAARSCTRPGRGLADIDDGALGAEDPPAGIEAIADPPRPILRTDFLSDFDGGHTSPRRLRRWLAAGAALLAGVALLLAWRYTPLAAMTDPALVADQLGRLDQGAFGLPLTVLVFVLGGLVVFPVTVLIAGTAAAFGLWPGILYASAGAMASALATYAIGWLVGARPLRRVMGPRINRIRQAISDHGVIAVATIRLVPVAPFTFVNLVAGASRIPLADYLIGTALGLAPGIAVMSSLGENLLQLLRDPTPAGIARIALLVAGWIALSFGFHALVRRMRARARARGRNG